MRNYEKLYKSMLEIIDKAHAESLENFINLQDLGTDEDGFDISNLDIVDVQTYYYEKGAIDTIEFLKAAVSELDTKDEGELI
jgi:hypothetical protein